MSYKSRYEWEDQKEKIKHSQQETDVTKAQRENAKCIKSNTNEIPQNYQNTEEQGKGFFYILLLIQALIILGSYYMQMEHLYYDKIEGHKSDSAAFQEYCKNTNYCQKIIQKEGNKSEYQIINYWPNQLHWISLIAYPLFLMNQYFIRDISFLRKIAFLFTIISYPCLFLFVQILLIYIRNYFEYYQEQLQTVFWIYLASIVFFMLNHCVLEIKNLENGKITYLTFLAFIVNVLYNQLSYTNANWTFYILTIVYIQSYFNHIDANLFNDNKYIEENKTLIRIIINKILEPLKTKGINRNQFNNHIVLNKKFTIIYMIIMIFIYSLVSIFQQEWTVIILVSIILIFVLWDTSLVSTTTYFTSDDQWLAANLFFLDFFLPIRNILMLLFLD